MQTWGVTLSAHASWWTPKAMLGTKKYVAHVIG